MFVCDENLNYKNKSEKHSKYLKFYEKKKKKYDEEKKKYENMEEVEEFWAMGIENEMYLMCEKNEDINSEILINNIKRERYSVDYFLNYRIDEYKNIVSNIQKINIPYYISSYMFNNVDIYGEHRTLYVKGKKYNKLFSGMSIHEYLNYTSNNYKKLFEKNNVCFDGDTIEFITNNFYKITLPEMLEELNSIKYKYLLEINKYISNKFIFSNYGKYMKFPEHNYGIVKYMTNLNNISICNSGTYHINITLPSRLSLNKMKIENFEEFKEKHKNAIKYIQWVEPLIIALYGTPDILSCFTDNNSCNGSLRLMMSRYIGLGTYDTDKMYIGKKLNDYEYENENEKEHYFNKLHNSSSLYIPPKKIGYDVNFNKFKNHGIELRFLDYFPESYLEDVINFILLVCQHSIYNPEITKPQSSKLWNELALLCIKNGSNTEISNDIYQCLLRIFKIEKTEKTLSENADCCFFSCFTKEVKEKESNKEQEKNHIVINVITEISEYLFEKYKNDESIIKKMSPNIKRIVWVDYNSIMREKFKKEICV